EGKQKPADDKRPAQPAGQPSTGEKGGAVAGQAEAGEGDEHGQGPLWLAPEESLQQLGGGGHGAAVGGLVGGGDGDGGGEDGLQDPDGGGHQEQGEADGGQGAAGAVGQGAGEGGQSKGDEDHPGQEGQVDADPGVAAVSEELEELLGGPAGVDGVHAGGGTGAQADQGSGDQQPASRPEALLV